MWPGIIPTLLAPLGVAAGTYLSHAITDETHDKNYVWWFFGFALAGFFSTAFFSEMILTVLAAASIASYALYKQQFWLVAVLLGILLVFTQQTGQYLLLVSLLAICAYATYHKKQRHLWFVAVLPTLISSISFLL